MKTKNIPRNGNDPWTGNGPRTGNGYLSRNDGMSGLTNLDSGLKVHMTQLFSQSDRTVSVLKYQLIHDPPRLVLLTAGM